ncbi:MAG: helix-turn-helix domain-containing protein, partial [Bacillota bacterium]
MKISEIIIDENIYPRTSLCVETVERYLEAIESGVKLPEIIITPDNRLLDGRHRLEAHKLAGVDEVEVIVKESEDPDVDSVICNLKHGRPLAKEEIKAAARRWYGKMPVQQIAETLKVTRQTVQNWVADLVKEKEETREKIREKALEMRAEGLTQEEVAEKLGVPRQTISRWENKEY